MRRLAPWVLLALVLVGAGIGAVVGQAGAPPRTPAASTATGATAAARWVDELLAATKAAGSAHFSFSEVSTSPTAVFNTTLSGRGVVAFGQHRVRVTGTERQANVNSGAQQPHQAATTTNVVSMITVGKQTWEGIAGQWIKIQWPRSSFDRLGLSTAAGPSLALAGIEGPEPVVGVRMLGPAALGGVATTRYSVTTARPRPCNARQAAETAGDFSGPTTLWVDGHGRLVQARQTTHSVFRIPASLRGRFPSDVPAGPVVATATLRFGQFGVPVDVTAPRNPHTPPRGSSVTLSVHSCR